MSNRCSILRSKRPSSGHSVSHSNVKTKRRFLVNSHSASFYSDALNMVIKLDVSTSFLRTVAKKGGIDRYFASPSARMNKLTAEGMKLRVAIRKKIGVEYPERRRQKPVVAQA